MEAMRESWTDDRLDDLANRMDAGFDRVDKDIRELRSELSSRFDSIEGKLGHRFDAIDRRFEAFDRRFDSLYRVMIVFSGSVVVCLFGLIGSVVITQA